VKKRKVKGMSVEELMSENGLKRRLGEDLGGSGKR